MTRYLADANVLLALGWQQHEHNLRAHTWLKSDPAIVFLGCAVTELAFLRVSLANSAIAARYPEAVQALSALKNALGPRYLYEPALPAPAELLPPATTSTPGHKTLGDLYLAAVATQFSARLATFDRGISGPAAFNIP